MIECSRKIEEEVKAMTSEIKENIQGTNSDGKETRTQINALDQKEERNIQPEQNEEFRKNERLRILQDIFKRSNIRIIGVPEREEEEQEIENSEGELSQSGKGNRLPGSPGNSESQRSWTQGSTQQGTS